MLLIVITNYKGACRPQKISDKSLHTGNNTSPGLHQSDLRPVNNMDMTVTLTRGEVPLNGPWAFKLGNDERWAQSQFDDRSWERVDFTPAPGAHDGDVGLPGYVPGWAARGHAGRWGHAWYRLHVRWSTTGGARLVLIGPTLVDAAYEIYWNGRRMGGIGGFGVAPPCIYGVHPQLFRLGETSSAGVKVLRVRTHAKIPHDWRDTIPIALLRRLCTRDQPCPPVLYHAPRQPCQIQFRVGRSLRS